MIHFTCKHQTRLKKLARGRHKLIINIHKLRTEYVMTWDPGTNAILYSQIMNGQYRLECLSNAGLSSTV